MSGCVRVGLPCQVASTQSPPQLGASRRALSGACPPSTVGAQPPRRRGRRRYPSGLRLWRRACARSGGLRILSALASSPVSCARPTLGLAMPARRSVRMHALEPHPRGRIGDSSGCVRSTRGSPWQSRTCLLALLCMRRVPPHPRTPELLSVASLLRYGRRGTGVRASIRPPSASRGRARSKPSVRTQGERRCTSRDRARCPPPTLASSQHRSVALFLAQAHAFAARTYRRPPTLGARPGAHGLRSCEREGLAGLTKNNNNNNKTACRRLFVLTFRVSHLVAYRRIRSNASLPSTQACCLDGEMLRRRAPHCARVFVYVEHHPCAHRRSGHAPTCAIVFPASEVPM